MGRARRAVVLGWLLSASLAAGNAQPPAAASPLYDIVIRNGRVIDGTGSPWYAGEVAIRDGKIAAITAPGGLKDVQARRIIDAGGRVVAPGFIDMLGQSERAVLADPHVESKIFQGITSEITGEGNSISPRNDAMIAQDQASVGPDVALPEFRTVGDYLRRLDAQGAAINLGTYVGATTIRRMVLGDTDRAPTAAELARMQELVRQAMRDGAFGLSSSLMYAPGVFAKTPELVALARAAAEFGGIYATHMRSEADGLIASLDETFRIARDAHIPVEIFHLKVAGPQNWGQMPEVVRRIDAARAQGLDIAADTYAYTWSGNPGSALLPPWVHAGGTAAMVARLRDPRQRAQIRAAIEHDRTWDNEWFMVKGPEGIVLSATSAESLKPLVGRTLAAIAAARHQDAEDAAIDLLALDPRLTVLLATMSETDVEDALRQPWVSVGLDAAGTSILADSAGRHPRAFATFPHILRQYVMQQNLLTLPEAIRRFTSLPAGRMHLADRGVLKAGMWADIVIFDPAKVRDTATYEHPNRLAEGMDWVLVNGVPVIAQGKPTNALPGRALRGAGKVN